MPPAVNSVAIEKACMTDSREIKLDLEGRLRCYVPHPMLRADREELYCGNGVHLSKTGVDIFLLDLQQS